MPHHHHKSPNLQLAGPIIQVIVIPPKPVIDALNAKGMEAPSQRAIGLIDTGASCTCIDSTIAQSLNLIPRDTMKVQTAAGEDTQILYDAAIILPVLPGIAITVQVLEAKLEKQPYKVLVGRDVLKNCTLVYNGWENSYDLHY